MIKKKSVKELLGESLEELLRNKSFEKITVQEIVENCGVGRRTFYNIFTDKHDLAAWLYLRQLNDFVDTTEHAQLADFIKYSTEVVNKDMQLIIAIDRYKGQNNLRDSLVKPMTDIYSNLIGKYYGYNVDPEMMKDIEFYVGGQITFVGRVIDSPIVPGTDEVTEFFIRCMPESLKRFI